jgi:tripartite-type tricarboxylate transporter receptor subunit TctC
LNLLKKPTEKTVMGKVIYWFLAASAGIFFFTAAGDAATQDFYQGKVIRIVVGFSPGGAFDAYSRSCQGTCENTLRETRP